EVCEFTGHQTYTALCSLRGGHCPPALEFGGCQMWRRLFSAAALAVVLVGLLTTRAAPAEAATYYNSRCGNTSGRVLLTFDDWAYGDPYRATRTGAYLQSRNIRAAFFLINQNAKNYPGIVSTLRQQGHWVLNHTYSHPNLTQLSDSNVSWQIRNGIYSNRLRPPYGAYNSRVSSIAGGLGYRICTWTIDTRDWEYVNGSRRSTSSIRSIVRNSSWSAKSSGVILGHLYTNYPNAISGIIYDLHQQGLLFCRNRGPVGRTMPFPASCT
ncbi:MAG TPA: polysaccharide deacetylase family protein, partial [Propionibacteriaceae bacterium]|nr:polysaccharide deacetylase family protein [Propionibacteriaceae bacterium]